MEKNKTRDIVVVVIVLLVVLALFLTEEDEETGDRDSEAKPEAGTEPQDVGEESPGDETYQSPLVAGAASPIESLPHRYFPLVSGSKWIYQVEGPQRFVPHPHWTMTLVTAPQGEQPGTITVGFGDASKTTNIWLDERGSLRFDGLPFVEPIEFLGNRPLKVKGEFLPVAARIGEDAVWVQEFEREVDYQYRDEKGRPRSSIALAKQRDRAQLTDFDEIAVPAGRFRAMRVSWLSRIEIQAGDRPVLKDLTSEPFKKETMWIVSGIGIVRRRIDYSGYRGTVLSFDLLRYDRPESDETARK